jgi:hypothetical protein
LWIEALRVDTASIIFGLRVNIWLSILGIGGSLLTFAIRGFRRRPGDSDEPYTDGHRWSLGADVDAIETIPATDTTATPQHADPAPPESPSPESTATETDQESDHESL